MERWRCSVHESVWRVLALGVLSLVWLPVGGRAQALGPEALVDGFGRAWNTHDMNGFAGLFTDDADWVTVGGVRVKGRAAIQAVLEKEHATWAKTTTFTALTTEVRFLCADVALIHVNWEITGAIDREGKLAGPSRGINVIVAAKQPDGWRVIAGQVNRQTPARPGA
jgi:uncharacterized protein (TIGR02246 family)